MKSFYRKVQEESLKEYQDAVGTVCLLCCEDTINDETICNNCPVRKSVDYWNNFIQKGE